MIETITYFLLFLLSFLISIALLRKLNIFPKGTNVIISVVIAFYFISASIYFSENLFQIIAYSLLILFVIFIVAAIYKGGKPAKKTSEKSK